MTRETRRRRPLRWYSLARWRVTLLGASILGGAALWVVAVINLVRHAR